MVNTIPATKLEIIRAHMSFFLPFGYDSRKTDLVITTLFDNGYSYFHIKNAEEFNSTYGNDITVSGEELEQYFLPYIERKLFPSTIKDEGFHRFTKVFAEPYTLSVRDSLIPFIVRSIDIILGPFGIAFINLRTELASDKTELSDVLDFMNHFRSLEPKLDENKGAQVLLPASEPKDSIHAFIFEHLCPFLSLYVLKDRNLTGYFGTLPYFDDDRMYATGFLFASTESLITEEHLFRVGNLNGRSPTGEPFIGSSNAGYIHKTVERTVHDRWAPHSYTVTTEHAFITITNQPTEQMQTSLAQYMGTHYYNFLLHYFYKIMLIRVAYEYSELVWNKDDEYVKSLTKLITLFSCWYYFKEISTRSEGKELAKMFRQSHNIENLFQEVNTTLHELYRNQESVAADRMNILLFTLTIFTVISGIYGMNLVISDWEEPFLWNTVFTYTFFEWISLLTALSGIGLSVFLVFTTVGNSFWKKWRMRKSNSHM